jgi:hypothetical protein
VKLVNELFVLELLAHDPVSLYVAKVADGAFEKYVFEVS